MLKVLQARGALIDHFGMVGMVGAQGAGGAGSRLREIRGALPPAMVPRRASRFTASLTGCLGDVISTMVSDIAALRSVDHKQGRLRNPPGQFP